MYLSYLKIENFRCFGEGDNALELHLKKGLTALVGENDIGKSAIVDALRIVLGTSDQEWYPRLEQSDFHQGNTKLQISITCRFDELTTADKRAFLEYLTYTDNGEIVLYIKWTANDTGQLRKGQPYRQIDVCAGENGDGLSLIQAVRDLLRATYLRPLRDADLALSAGRGSRLAQILRCISSVKENGSSKCDHTQPLKDQNLSIEGISRLANSLLENHEGIRSARNEINKNLESLALSSDSLTSSIQVGTSKEDEARLRELLAKLDLTLAGHGKSGLGSNNLLFIACELLLLANETEGNKLLLIEEPEAHLHAQRQLTVMQYLQQEVESQGIQVIVTTHSPNLASAIKLDNIVMLNNCRAYSLAQGQTQLEATDYRFLERFLDVTKANLFFARGVMIVEGDAENILIPTIAKLIGRDFTKHGVSIVNVGGVGLRRYARIFQRKYNKDRLKLPVACVTDFDVIPDAALSILPLDETKENRHWKCYKDLSDDLKAHREEKEARASGGCVKTFVSDYWTFEYDLAMGQPGKGSPSDTGLARDVFVAAKLAGKDEAIHDPSKQDTVFRVTRTALRDFSALSNTDETSAKLPEELAAHAYRPLTKGVSKTIAAQYLAERLEHLCSKGRLTLDDLRNRLPRYLVEAIYYVTTETDLTDTAATLGSANE